MCCYPQPAVWILSKSNISEARNQETIRKIIKASQASIEAGGGPIRACVLKVFRDLEYNRSVITIR